MNDEPLIVNLADAARYDASVKQAINESAEAYADWRREPWEPVPSPWPLGGGR